MAPVGRVQRVAAPAQHITRAHLARLLGERPIRPARAAGRSDRSHAPLILRALVLGAALLPCLTGQAQAETAAPPSKFDLTDRWELDFDSGALWDVGGRATPLDYTFLPQIVTLKTGAFITRRLGDGDLVVRTRLSLLVEPIVRGPETHFTGIAAAPSIEWWNPVRTISAFFSIGGGFGWMDARGQAIPGAQGQDFNLTWFMHGGVRYRLTDRLSAALGLYFQHVSNGGMDQVNPGVDALGPMVGIGWHF